MLSFIKQNKQQKKTISPTLITTSLAVYGELTNWQIQPQIVIIYLFILLRVNSEEQVYVRSFSPPKTTTILASVLTITIKYLGVYSPGVVHSENCSGLQSALHISLVEK